MRAILSLVLVTLGGCAAGYQVTELTDKFSDPTKPAIYTMRGNAIDHRDPLGIMQTSELNCIVARNRATGKVDYIGLHFKRVAQGSELVFTGAPKWLTVRAGDELVFLADGERVVFKATGGTLDHSVTPNSITGPTAEYYDFAEYRGTPEQLRKIANASTLEFQVNGLNGSVSFPRRDRSLLDTFVPNIHQFYRDQVAPFL